MEYGLIKDTTIQGIADSLRDKGFIPATRLEDVQRESFHYATENVTSDTDATPAYNANSDLPEIGILGYSPIITEMPGASSIELVVDIGLVHPDDTIATQCGRFEIYDRNDTHILSEPINKDYKGKHTYIVPGDYVRYGRNSSYTTMKDCYTAFIVDLYPLDADGNRISYLSQEQVPNTITPSEMAEVLNNCATPLPESALKITGDCTYRFANNGWNWFINLYGDKITTENITQLRQGFGESNTIASLPFDINISDAWSLANCFNNLNALTESPRIRGTLQIDTNFTLDNLISSCYNVRDFSPLFLPEMLDGFKDVKVTSSYLSPYPSHFTDCHSLRQIPEWWYKFKYCEESTVHPAAYRSLYYVCFRGCYTLDEALNIPVWECAGAATSQMFESMFGSCYRLKDFTFETQADGTPYTAKWKTQTLDLTSVGYITIPYGDDDDYYLGYNSGITKDKMVYDDASYQALKNDPDWYPYVIKNGTATASSVYSRYDHDSAVRTINSLPDTSAYLASAGGTNTIKFRGISGELTDAGAINTLTAEEIAVAAAKGWTVSIV